MEWLDLLAPSAAILAVFATIGLLVQSVRHGRAIRRLEHRLAERGEAADEAPLQRIAELQARAQVGAERAEGGGAGVGLRAGLAVLSVVAALVVAAGAVWYFALRDGDVEAGAGEANGQTTAARAVAPPRDETVVPEKPPPLANKSVYTVTVFNASGVSGVAAGTIAPRVEAEGYTLGLVENPPDGTSDLRQSVVMYAEGRKRVGQAVADDLDISRAAPIDGLTTEQIGGADAVVLVGRDLAARP